MRLAITLGILPLALLAGCQSEAQQLASARTEALEKCNSDPRIATGMSGMDSGRFCTCLTDKMFEGRSLADLEKMGEDANKTETQRAAIEWSAQCAADQLRSGTAQGAATAPAATPAAPGSPAASLPTVAAPAVPPQAQDAAAATIEEAADEAN